MFRSIIDWIAWSQYTPVIPKFYVNAKSLEKANIELACRFDRLCHYIQYIIDECNKIIVNYNKYKEDTDKKLKSMQKQIDDLTEKIHENDSIIYDPTQGKYVNSQEAMRNIYQHLSVFGQTVEQMKNHSVKETAENTVGEHAVVGNYYIEKNKDPRIKYNEKNN